MAITSWFSDISVCLHLKTQNPAAVYRGEPYKLDRAKRKLTVWKRLILRIQRTGTELAASGFQS